MRWIFAAALLSTMSTPAVSAELRSIADILAQESSDANNQYALKRCSAVYVTMSGLMLVDGGSQELSTRAGELSARFFSLAMLHAEKFGLPADADDVTKTIFSMSEIYTNEAADNFLKTGNRLEGVFLEDSQWCKAVVDALDQN